MNYEAMGKEAEKTGATEQLTPVYREFKKAGDKFVGRLKAVSAVESGLSETTYNQYLFETDDGLIKCAFGGATDKEAGQLMKVDRVYLVEFKGKETITGGRQVNKFRIERIREEDVVVKEPGEEKT